MNAGQKLSTATSKFHPLSVNVAQQPLSQDSNMLSADAFNTPRTTSLPTSATRPTSLPYRPNSQNHRERRVRFQDEPTRYNYRSDYNRRDTPQNPDVRNLLSQVVRRLENLESRDPSRPNRQRSLCYRCNSSTHYARNCNQLNFSPDFRNRSPTPRRDLKALPWRERTDLPSHTSPPLNSKSLPK